MPVAHVVGSEHQSRAGLLDQQVEDTHTHHKALERDCWDRRTPWRCASPRENAQTEPSSSAARPEWPGDESDRKRDLTPSL